VEWNGTPLTTTFLSNKLLTASVPDAFVAAVGLGSITVVTPGVGGRKSGVTYVPVAAAELATQFPSTPTTSVAVGSNPQGLVTADFDADGKLDLAVANNADDTVSILLGNGAGAFTTKSTPAAGSGANWIAVGDFDGDGILDIAVANAGSTGAGGVSILLGNGDGTFTLRSSLNTGSGPFALTTGDFNADGHLDLAVSNTNDATVTILLGVGDGTFMNTATLVVGSLPQVIVAGDFNEDGNLDLAVANGSASTVSVLLGDGLGGFGAQTTFPVGGSGQPIGLITADLNGDGHLDLAAVNLGDVAILLGTGTGAFTLHANPGGTGTSDLIAGVVGDYNGDGILDLVVSDRTAGEAFLFPGTGSGNFGAALTFTTAVGAFGVATADFNGDGGLDLAVANGSANNVSIFLQLLPVELNPSSLTFGIQAVSTPSSSQAVTVKNNTGGTLNFSGIGFTGTDSGDFSQTNTCGASIGNGATCAIDVTFTPSASGSRVATLTVQDNGSNSPQTLAVSGIGGVAPSIAKSFSPTTVAVNAPSTVTFSITNGNAVTIHANFTDTLPANSVVDTTPNVVNSCGGTVTAVAGSGTISFTNAALAAGICSVAVNVRGTAEGVFNNSVTINSADAGNGNTASASLTAIIPPSIVKAFGASTIPLNGVTSLTFTINSSNGVSTLNGIAFADNLPAGLVVAVSSNLSTTCGGTGTAVGGSGSVSLTSVSLAPNTSCTLSLDIMGTTAGVKNNSVQVTSTNGGTGNTSNASITVIAAPVIINAFGAASIPLNGSTSLSFTVQNNNTTQSLSGVAFTDTLPAGLVVSTPNGLSGICGCGTLTATQGTNVISLSGANLAQSSSCTLSVNVTGIAAGLQNNTTGNITSTQGGTGGTASASLAVVAPPSIAKAFSPAAIALSTTTSLTFTITNPDANTVSLTGVAFTDTIPTGLTVANASATVCGGTLTTTAPTGIALTGATIATSSQCQFSVTVTGASAGNYTNTTGAVTSTNGGTGNTGTANLTVASPPTITKAFGAASIALNGTTSLTFTVSNPNSNVTLTGLAFTDTFPAGLAVAPTSNLSNTCGGTATAVPGAGSVSLASGTLAASASCTVSLNVQSTTGGVKNNSVQVTSTEGGTGNTSNASIAVTAPPVIIKAFGAASIPLNGSTSLSFTIQNNNTTQSLSSIGFSDTLPAGLIISTPNGQTTTCGAATITGTQGTNVISLSGATLAQSSSCTFSVNVTGIAAGQQNNTTGAVTSTEGGTGGTASSSLVVVAPPSIAKAFGVAAIPLNSTTSLTFTITNPAANTVPLTGVALTDTIPTGLTVASASATVCGGTLTTTAPTGIALSGASVATNSQCQFSVTVTGAASGNYTNTTSSVTSTNGGTGNTGTANLSVASPPVITKVFGAPTIALAGSTTLAFTINNPVLNTIPLTGIAFTDALPAGLQVSAPSGLTGSCGGGAITAVAGSSSVSLAGATVAVSGSCTFTVNVLGLAAGVQNNNVTVTSTNAGAGNTSNASVIVVAPPTVLKSFGAASIVLGASTSLSFTINNPNTATSLTGIGFGDALPAGLVVSTPNALTGTCGGGTIGAVAGSHNVTLTGAALAGTASCSFAVNVTGIAGGAQNNVTAAISSTEGGVGATASASVTVLAADLTLTGSHVGNFKQGLTGASYTVTVSNQGVAATVGAVTVMDNLPSALTATAVAGSGWTCTLGTLSCTRSDSLATGASYPPVTLTVNVSGVAPASVTNTAVVSGGGETNTSNDSAPDVTNIDAVAPDFSISMTPATNSVKAGVRANYTITLTPLNNVPVSSAIVLSAAGLPLRTSSTFQAASVTPGLNAATDTFVILTTQADPFLASNVGVRELSRYATWLPFVGLLISGIGFRKRVRAKTKAIRPWFVVGLGCCVLVLVGCASVRNFQKLGTPPGAYTITVTATSGSVQHSSTVSLTVQP
jgi:uncharacterized repeat protein (TIGR01451 family)